LKILLNNNLLKLTESLFRQNYLSC